MHNRKAALLVIISITVTILLMCIFVIILNNSSNPIEWVMDKIISLRLFRYSILITFQDTDDVNCMDTIFESMDVEVKAKHILDEKNIKYDLASEYPLPNGWLDRFSYKKEIELYDSYKNRLIYSSDIESMSYSFNSLIIRMKGEYQREMTDYYDESLEILADGQWMDCDVFYRRDINAYELTSKKPKDEQLETVLINSLVSFYSYPTCSNIVVEYNTEK